MLNSTNNGKLRHIRRDIAGSGGSGGTGGAGNNRNHRTATTPSSGLYNAGLYSTSGRNPISGSGGVVVGGIGGMGGIGGAGSLGGRTGVIGGMMGNSARRGAGSQGGVNATSSSFMWSRYDTFGNDENNAIGESRQDTNGNGRGIFGSDENDTALYSQRNNNPRSQPISSSFIMDDPDQDYFDEPTMLGSFGTSFLLSSWQFIWRRRPRSFGGVAVLGIVMAFGIAFLADLNKQRNYYNDERSGLFGVAHLPRAIVDSVLDVATKRSWSGASDPMGGRRGDESDLSGLRPEFVYEHPYVSSSYYTSTKSLKTLLATDKLQVQPKLLVGKDMDGEGSGEREIQTRLAIVRPFCEFDAEALPTTFACWNALPPCKAASDDIGDEEDYEYELGPNGEFVAYKNSTAGRELYENFGEHHFFDQVGSDAMKSATADVFLFYSQTFSENEVAIKAVDTIIDQFFEPGGWSQCFDNIYAIEANIPQELDLYIPSAQEELYNWVNGPNRQFEAAFRIIQSGEWGDYDGFYLMEGDSVPIKAHWLDVVLSEIEVNRPFAILGAQYDGDKWDNFYEKIPISLLHHTNGNAIYNTSHPLLERLVGQLEVEAPCPYNSIPYDYRMSQMWVEGTLGIVPKLAPKIMLNEEGENITLSNNTEMFLKWAEIWQEEDPFKYTPVIHNYAATNLIPRHLGPEYIIHGAKLYSPWDPTKTEVTLVVSEWFFDRSLHLISNLDDKDHPFSEVVVMVPPAAITHDDYDLMTEVPIRTQHRGAPDFMDLCEADIKTEWFMITNSYHHVARHVDLMFTPGTFKPVIPFTPATYAFCFKYPYCKETINLAQRFNPGHDKVVQDMDMLYNTEMRDAFCKEWKEQNGEEGEDMYKNQQRRLMFRKKIIGPPGPTGTSYYAWLVREGKDGIYKLTDRSLYGARPPFVKIFAREEKLDGMSEDELAKRVGMTLLDNSTDCNCMTFETEVDCVESGIGCIWRPLFESCHPPELVDGDAPICPTTEAPTSAPTVSIDGMFDDTEGPTAAPVEPLPESDPWYVNLFKSRESEQDTVNSATDGTEDLTLLMDDDDAILEPDVPVRTRRTTMSQETDENEMSVVDDRKLEAVSLDSFYEPDLSADHRRRILQTDSLDSLAEIDSSSDPLQSDVSVSRKLEADKLDSFYETELSAQDRSGNLKTDTLDSLDKIDGLDLRRLNGRETEVNSLYESESSPNYGRYLQTDSLIEESPSRRHSNISQSDSGLINSDIHIDIDRFKSFSRENIPLPSKQCDSWDPSIVPRKPTAVNTWDGASPDPESRAYSPMAISRPRRLHRTFLQYQVLLSQNPSSLSFSQAALESLIETVPPYQDSWLTSSVPINIPKYELHGEDSSIKHIALGTPESKDESLLPNMYRTFVNYGETHPFEGAQIVPGVTFQPLRVTFVTDHLLDFVNRQRSKKSGGGNSKHATLETINRVEALTGDILPSVSEIWAAALSVVRSVDNIFVSTNGGPNQGKCGEADIPRIHSVDGVPNTDTLVYVTVNGPKCFNNQNLQSGNAGMISYASICTFDQHMRPISANLVVCLDEIDASFGEVSEQEILRLTASLTMEVGKILGLSTSLFQHFRNPDTGKPWGVTKKSVTCVDGREKTLSVPNVLRSSLDVDSNVRDKDYESYFQIVTPTVRQVVRNHFDCQTLKGAILDRENAESCFGDSFDPRYHFDEDLTAVGGTADMAYSLSPLTLALLEDSSWYRADFSKSTVPLFGRGAGCGFVEGDCMTKFMGVPDYSRGFFCNDVSQESSAMEYQTSSCDFTHNHKADCQVSKARDAFDENDIFNDDLGGPVCPMRTVNIVACSDKSNLPSLSGELFSINSRCFETDTPSSVCLESYCNSVDTKIDIVVGGKVHQCDYEGQHVDLGHGYSIRCPRLAIACPHLVCPASCSGKGVCDYCLEIPQCVCDDPFDETPGCWGDFTPAV